MHYKGYWLFFHVKITGNILILHFSKPCFISNTSHLVPNTVSEHFIRYLLRHILDLLRPPLLYTAPSRYLHTGYFWYRHTFYAQPSLSVRCRKAQFLFHLTIDLGSSSVKRTPGAYVSGVMSGKAFFWHAFQIIC